MTIIKRADLGRPLTWDELDDNFRQVDDLAAAASVAVSNASVSATAAAGSAIASANSANSAANSAANAAAATVSAVKSTVTFTTGGTLNSILDRISDGTYLYYWTGAYPLTVPAGSTVSGTGGLGVGFWATDTEQLLRDELSQNTGAELSGLMQGGTVQTALTRVNVLSFGADRTGVLDSSNAVRLARNYAITNNINEIYFPAGDYLCADFVDQIPLPCDDGTVYPAWVGVNGDINIASETQYYAYTFCKLPSGMRITGDGKEATKIRGTWVNSTSSVPTGLSDTPTTAGYGPFWTAGSKDALNNHSIIGLTLAHYFVARSGDGIMVESFEDDLGIDDCAIEGIFQGAERCHSKTVFTRNALAGLCVGGHWLQRNNAQTKAYLPPYPAIEIYRVGWCDGWVIDYHDYVQWQGVWVPTIHDALDTYFDNSYFKSANSKTYATGGRLSNNSNNTGTIPVWFGIVGRARNIYSRYGRGINSNSVGFDKILGCHRTPEFLSTTGVNVLYDIYVEGVGLVDNRANATSGNLFGTDYVDPLNPTGVGVGYTVARGGVQINDVTISARVPHAEMATNSHTLYGERRSNLYIAGTVAGREMSRESVWNGSTTSIKYQKFTDSFFTQPLYFSTGGAKFSYSEESFTPTLTSNDVLISNVTGTGFLVKSGKMVVIRCVFTPVSPVTLPAGVVKVEGIPRTVLADSVFGGASGFFRCAQLNIDTTIVPRINTTTVRFMKGSKGTLLDGSDFVASSSLQIFVDIVAVVGSN